MHNPELCHLLYAPHHATALYNVSQGLKDVAHLVEALDANNDAVELYLHLAANDRDTFYPNLANCLHDLSCCMSDLGDQENALDAAREAVELYRRLAADHPAVFNPRLAYSLNNLSNCFSSLGHREDALAAIREAIELYQHFAANHPAVCDPHLAGFLHNLSNCLSDLGNREDALKAICEVIVLYRQLARDNPTRCNCMLASVLYKFSNLRSSGPGRGGRGISGSNADLITKVPVILKYAASGKYYVLRGALVRNFLRRVCRHDIYGGRNRSVRISMDTLYAASICFAGWDPSAGEDTLVMSLGRDSRLLLYTVNCIDSEVSRRVSFLTSLVHSLPTLIIPFQNRLPRILMIISIPRFRHQFLSADKINL